MLIMVCRNFYNHVDRWSLAQLCSKQKMMLWLDGEVPITKPANLPLQLPTIPQKVKA